MLEYGKLLRTLHALRWFTDEAFRRRIGVLAARVCGVWSFEQATASL